MQYEGPAVLPAQLCVVDQSEGAATEHGSSARQQRSAAQRNSLEMVARACGLSHNHDATIAVEPLLPPPPMSVPLLRIA